MKQLDSSRVANLTLKCGKKLKVGVVAQQFVQCWNDLAKDHPAILDARKKMGEMLFEEVFQTLITYYSLNLLALTHTTKEFENMFEDCEVEASEEEETA